VTNQKGLVVYEQKLMKGAVRKIRNVLGGGVKRSVTLHIIFLKIPYILRYEGGGGGLKSRFLALRNMRTAPKQNKKVPLRSDHTSIKTFVFELPLSLKCIRLKGRGMMIV
jgi:hypothetical protein